MIDQSVNLDFKITADDSAQPDIEKLSARLDELQAQLALQRRDVPASSKDWADYAEQLGRIAEEVAAAGVSFAAMRMTMLQTDIVTSLLSKWTGLVNGVSTAYSSLNNTLLNMADYSLAAVNSGQEALAATLASSQIEAAKFESRIGSLVARFADLGAVANALSLGAVVLTLADIAIRANAANEETRLLTETIGGLSGSLQELDPASNAVREAKEKFDALYKASLALKEPIDALLPSYKAFFDQTGSTSLSVQTEAEALTDLLNVHKHLGSSQEETARSQARVNEAFDEGITSVSDLGIIFGSALQPALEDVAGRMRITKDTLIGLIDSGKVTTESVFPALAASARDITKNLDGLGSAASFSTEQFDKLGMSLHDMAQRKLPGTDNALRHTAIEIKNTVDASVEPIKAAVENIVNMGAKIEDWAKRVKQGVGEALSGGVETYIDSIKTGFSEVGILFKYVAAATADTVVGIDQSILEIEKSATHASSPIKNLGDIWDRVAEQIKYSRDAFNAQIDALEGVDNASLRAGKASDALRESFNKFKDVKLDESLQDVIDKLNKTRDASTLVGAVWAGLQKSGDLAFSGTSLKNLLILNQSINAVANQTEEATKTQEAFARAIASLPKSEFDALHGKVVELKGALDKDAEAGNLFQAVMTAAIIRIAEEQRKLTESADKYASSIGYITTLDEKRAETSNKLTKLLYSEAEATQSSADRAAISAETAQTETVAKQHLADVADQYYVKLLSETQGIEKRTDEAKKALEVAKDEAAQKSVEAAKSKEVTRQLQLEAAKLQGVADAHRINIDAIIRSKDSAVKLEEQLKSLGVAYDAAKNETDRLSITQKAGIDVQNQLDAAMANEVRTLTAFETAIDLVNRKEANRINAIYRANQLDRERHQLLIDQEKAMEAEAKATGDVADAHLHSAFAKQEEINKELSLIEGLRNEISVLRELLELKRQEVALSPDPTRLNDEINALDNEIKSKEILVKSTQTNVDTLREERDAVDGSTESIKQNTPVVQQNTTVINNAAASMDLFAQQILIVIKDMYGLSKAAGDAFVGIKQPVSMVSAEMQELMNKVTQVGQTIKQNLLIMGTDPGWSHFIERANRITMEFWQQREQVQRLQEDLNGMLKSGKVNTEELLQAEESLRHGFSLLDEQQLTGLRSALAEVQAEVKQTNNDLLQLIAETKANLGDQSDLLRLQHQQRLQQIADDAAKAGADRRLVEEAIRLENEYYAQLLKNAGISATAFDPATQAIQGMTDKLDGTLSRLGQMNTMLGSIHSTAVDVGNAMSHWGGGPYNGI